MARKTPVAIFMAATALVASNALTPSLVNSGEKNNGMGGLTEWTTDQEVDEKSTLDEEAKKAAKKAKKSNICIPIGEGENCW